MTEIFTNNSSLSCINLEINNELWPNDYPINNRFLKYTVNQGLSWELPQLTIDNKDENDVSIGYNHYLVLNQERGSSLTDSVPITNNYLRAGLGTNTGGIDHQGTGLSYTPRGQITIGLNEEDTGLSNISSYNGYGASMTEHISMTYKEISIIDNKDKPIHPIIGGADFNKSLFTSSKLDHQGLKLMENGNWIHSDSLSTILYNKGLYSPLINGDLIFPCNHTNTSIGSNSGDIQINKEKKQITGNMVSHKNISKDLSLKEGYYNNWEIETNTNDIITNHIIEEYNVGYSKIYGKFDDNNTLQDNENTFNKTNDYYLGWNLVVYNHTRFKVSNVIEETIPCGNTIILTPPSQSQSSDEVVITLDKSILSGSQEIELDNIRHNIDGYTISLGGLRIDPTSGGTPLGEVAGDGDYFKDDSAGGGPRIRLSQQQADVLYQIPVGTIVEITSDNSNPPFKERAIIRGEGDVSWEANGNMSSDIRKLPASEYEDPGFVSIIYLLPIDNTGDWTNWADAEGGLRAGSIISLCGFSPDTTVTGIDTSLIDNNYTVTYSGIPENTTVLTHTQNNDTGDTIELNNRTDNTIIVSDTCIQFTPLNGGTSIIKYVKDNVPIGTKEIKLKPPSAPTLNNYIVSIPSLTAKYLDPKESVRSWDLTNENDNMYSYLPFQLKNTEFYLSTQNKESVDGIIYGEKRGQMDGELRLANYHGKKEKGFYIGWGIYTWDPLKIYLNKRTVGTINKDSIIKAIHFKNGEETVILRTTSETVIGSYIINVESYSNYDNLNNYTLIMVDRRGIKLISSPFEDDTQIKVPYGIIQSYNPSTFGIQVKLNEVSFNSNAGSEYLLVPKNMMSNNKLNLHNNYYKGWTITVEQDKIQDGYIDGGIGFSGKGGSEPMKYLIDEYLSENNEVINYLSSEELENKITGHVPELNTDVSNLLYLNLPNDLTIKSFNKMVIKDYFKDWIIRIWNGGEGSTPSPNLYMASISSPPTTFVGIIKGNSEISSGNETNDISIVVDWSQITEGNLTPLEGEGGLGPNTLVGWWYNITYNNDITVLSNIEREQTLHKDKIYKTIEAKAFQNFNTDMYPSRIKGLLRTYKRSNESEQSSHGGVDSIVITNSGSGYSNPPTLTFDESPSGSEYTATATCTLSSGPIDTVNITYSGEGYTGVPDITFDESPSGIVYTATATCTLSSGSIDTISITNNGDGYITAPTLTFEASPSGSEYTATATCTLSTNGSIDTITITNNGSGYITAPSITLSEVLNGASLTSVIDTSSNNIYIGGTDRVQFILNDDVANNESWTNHYKDYSPPSSIDNYYKGWQINIGGFSTNESNTQKIRNIIHYDGANKIATLDGDNLIDPFEIENINGNINNIVRGPYILTKRLNQSEYFNGSELYIKRLIVIKSGSGYDGGNDTGNGITIDQPSLLTSHGGEGYKVAPTITFDESPSGSEYTATATCTLLSGSIDTVNITYRGSGYITAPTLTFDEPPSGSVATATCTLSTNGSIDTITITSNGSGYTTIPSNSIPVHHFRRSTPGAYDFDMDNTTGISGNFIEWKDPSEGDNNLTKFRLDPNSNPSNDPNTYIGNYILINTNYAYGEITAYTVTDYEITVNWDPTPTPPGWSDIQNQAVNGAPEFYKLYKLGGIALGDNIPIFKGNGYTTKPDVNIYASTGEGAEAIASIGKSNIPLGTYVTEKDAKTITLSNNLATKIQKDTLLTFTPPNSIQLNTLIVSVNNLEDIIINKPLLYDLTLNTIVNITSIPFNTKIKNGKLVNGSTIENYYNNWTFTISINGSIKTGTISNYSTNRDITLGSSDDAYYITKIHDDVERDVTLKYKIDLTVSSGVKGSYKISLVSQIDDISLNNRGNSSGTGLKTNYIISITDEERNYLVHPHTSDLNKIEIISNQTNIERIIGWFVTFNNDKKYKISYENYTGQISGSNTLSNLSSNINDFYKGWTIIIPNEDIDRHRCTTNITGYTYSNTNQFKITTEDNITTNVNAKYILIPSKNIKYGSNSYSNITNNSTEFKLISPYNQIEDSNVLFEEGGFISNYQLSEYSSSTNHYYNNWKIMIYPTVSPENDKIIFHYLNKDYTIILKQGYYDPIELAEELKNRFVELNIAGLEILEVTYTNKKITIITNNNFTLKWKTTYDLYKSKSYILFGFNNSDIPSTDNKIVSPNEVSLYTSSRGECSIIDNYIDNILYINCHRHYDNMKAVSTTINENSKYKLVPPNHTNGKLKVIYHGNITEYRLEKNKCILLDNYYIGWIIIVTSNGVKQFSYITNYDKTTGRIEAPSLDNSKLRLNECQYFLSKHFHRQGILQTFKTIIIPERGVNTLSIEGFTSLNNNHPIEINLKLLGNNLSNIDDYYNNWTISIYIKDLMFNTRIIKYNGTSKIIEIEDFDYGLLKDYISTNTHCTYILYKPQIIKLSYDSIPINDFYKGWTISVNTDGIINTSIINSYNGETREIVAPNLLNPINEKSSYELIEHTEGVLKINNDHGPFQLSNLSSSINKYYNQWNISFINRSTNIVEGTYLIENHQADEELNINRISLADFNWIGWGKVNIIDAGSGYSTAPIITFSDPEITSGRRAIAEASIDGAGSINDVTILDKGSGYISPPSITLSEVLNGAELTATIGTDATSDLVGMEHKYKLYRGSHNTNIGYRSGINIKNGSRNISIGSNAGPELLNGNDNDKIYIDSSDIPLGDKSFIYGNMTKGSEKLKINGTLEANVLTVQGNTSPDNPDYLPNGTIRYHSSKLQVKVNDIWREISLV